MTLMFGTIVAFASGLAFGRRWYAFALAAVAWYVFLAGQTMYIAQPGVIAFGGENGQKTVEGAFYWIVQPPILGLSIGLLLLGAAIHSLVRRWIQTRRDTAPVSG